MIKQIEGYAGYRVSDKGQVYGKRGFPLKPYIHKKTGYSIVVLYKEGKARGFSVHKLVASAFILNPKKLPEVNHKDGNKRNNQAKNLEWCTRSQNVAHAYASGLRNTQPVGAYTKDGRLIYTFRSIKEAMAFLGVTYNTNISRCLHGKAKTAHGYVWRRIHSTETQTPEA